VSKDISLSTMWARGRYTDLIEFSRDARSWGYSAIEANAYVTSDGMLNMLTQGALPLSSLHNPCPNVKSSRDCSAYDLSLCSLDESERSEAVSFAAATIKQAALVGARAVVLHMGHVPVGMSMQRRLHSLWHEGKMDSEEYLKVSEHLLALRGADQRAHLERALETLRELEDIARPRGIMLGLETRHNVHEVPNLDEMGVLLAESDPAVVGYWHDTGHAETQERLGVARHQDWLERYSSRLIGIHLHDVNSERDHQCPGAGQLDWEMVARYVPDAAIRVCEIGEWNEEYCMAGLPPLLDRMGMLAPGVSHKPTLSPEAPAP
jgi:sugar phosphate isomerase/epimerase